MDNILKCCICGFENEKSILSHVRNRHQMSAEEYKEKFNMPLRVAWLNGNSEYFQKIGKINGAIMANQPGRATLHNKWSRNFDKCIVCCVSIGTVLILPHSLFVVSTKLLKRKSYSKKYICGFQKYLRLQIRALLYLIVSLFIVSNITSLSQH